MLFGNGITRYYFQMQHPRLINPHYLTPVRLPTLLLFTLFLAIPSKAAELVGYFLPVRLSPISF